MEDDDLVAHIRQIDDQKGAGVFTDTDFPHPWSDRLHRLPVRRVVTLLDFPQRIAGLGAGIVGKVSQTFKAVAKEDDRLHVLRCIDTDTSAQAQFLTPGAPYGFGGV